MRALLLLLAACTTTIEYTPDPPEPDPFDTAASLEEQGPPRYTSRLHGCPKMRYATLGNVLASRGVDLSSSEYTTSAQALGAPNYPARIRENIDLGLATSAKIFDIYIQAAPQIIAAFPPAACSGAQLFDASGKCVARGLSCLLGVPATQTHVDICNATIARAADVQSGRTLAVAVLLSAAHTCE